MPSSEDKLNEYSGFEPLVDGSHKIDRVSPDITPGEFFQNYISKRKPALITGHLTDPEWTGHFWTNSYLKEKAGDADIIVEKRGDAGFGLMAPKIGMKYAEFLSKLMAGDQGLYLTTQDLERFEDDVDDMGMPRAIMAEPLKSLAGGFPERPSILGNLIPHQLTLWQGQTKDGTSSGLHHDYHDNLYILVRGKKRFRLFPPSAAPQMQTSGELVKIHPNGLIVYRISHQNCEVPVRADGVSKEYLAKEKRDEAEAEMEEAEMELDEVMASDNSQEEKAEKAKKLKERILDCEERIELALEEMLRYVAAEEADSEEESEDSEAENDEPSKKKARLVTSGLNGSQTAGSQTVEQQQQQQQQQQSDHREYPQSRPHYPCMNYTVVACDHPALESGQIKVNELHKPDHFCNLSFPIESDDPEVVFKKCPEVKSVGHIVCEVSAGEMLYLPASWFHEVTSYSFPVDDNSDEAASDKGHLAVNYWMFPPDGAQFEQPYEDDFWQRRWERVQQDKQLGQSPPASAEGTETVS